MMLESWLNKFQNINYSRMMIKLKKKLGPLTLIGEKQNVSIVYDSWNMCCQLNSNFWSQQFFQTDVIVCRFEKSLLVVFIYFFWVSFSIWAMCSCKKNKQSVKQSYAEIKLWSCPNAVRQLKIEEQTRESQGPYPKAWGCFFFVVFACP